MQGTISPPTLLPARLVARGGMYRRRVLANYCRGTAPREALKLVIAMTNTMRQVTVAEAKVQRSSLLDVVEQGQPVVITRRGKAIAELVPRQAVRDLLP
ncbi:type II toxin-antitoxin system Phd/YefM family antitoxin [Cyanobium gracile]|uniref:Antitoxin n=1 Tax=Cyanobium gracile (strain ATCC 27147 / PCC 6307) TaxID=292564 RepID=K9PA29_CYAGP|nr:type II toxin-antitoxin system prevent-host-death family antitoxin [Cyanobium gracile]AFY29591.1 prevent-host-death family protein [Cyanobium gracile PCC 6307]